MTTYVEVTQAELDVLADLGHEINRLTNQFRVDPTEEVLLKIAETAMNIKLDSDRIARRTNVSTVSDNRA